MGALLLQKGEGQAEHLVSFFYKRLTPAPRNYSEVEQKLLAILLGTQHFEVYFPSHGPVIKIYSDHQSLHLLCKFKFKNQHLTR